MMRRFGVGVVGAIGLGLIVGLALWPAPDRGPDATNQGGGSSSTSSAGVSAPSTTRTLGPAATLTPDSTVPGKTLDQPIPPIRAAFFYPWFPEAWTQKGVTPYTNYSPSLGRYDSTNPSVIDTQIAQASAVGLDAFIASWWGPGHHTDDALAALLERSRLAPGTGPGLKWAVYYELEGEGDPSVSEILEHLDYLSSRYFDEPAYLRVDGKPVVFVWAGNDGSEMALRWAQAKQHFNSDLHVVLKVYSGYRDDPNQPDSWHQYGPAVGFSDHLPYSVTVSPGFFKVGETPRLERDPERFARDVERMVASNAFWQLITTWNEWGEGTSIEPAAEWDDTYLDILASHLAQTAPSTTLPGTGTSTTLDSGGTVVRFAAGGDIGVTEATSASLSMVRARSPDFFLALGDLSYNDLKPESAWCEYITTSLGPNIPVQLVVGNHEDDDRKDGWIGAFADCLPDRMRSLGNYPVEYYFDFGRTVRIIVVGAGNTVNGIDFDYTSGSQRMVWLERAIESARAQSIRWVVVAMHKNCLTVGEKGCEIGQDLLDVLTQKRVDLVLQGHDHTYQRSKQLSCGFAGRFEPTCVADDGSDGEYTHGLGTVFVVSGATGGGSLYETDERDPEAGYMAAWMGDGDPGEGRGFVMVTISSESLSAEFVGSTSVYRDAFTITR